MKELKNANSWSWLILRRRELDVERLDNCIRIHAEILKYNGFDPIELRRKLLEIKIAIQWLMDDET